jgi:hypothetical protein
MCKQISPYFFELILSGASKPMKIEMHLKRVLQEHNMNQRGTTQKIAKDLGVHRHTIGKLYKNTVSNISLSLLGDLCDWLIKNGVPRDTLPGALIGSCPSTLWQAIARPGSVTIYLGEYQEVTKGDAMWRWISKSDGMVSARFVECLSTPTTIGVSAPIVRTEYVPFMWNTQSSAPIQKPCKESLQTTNQIFEQMQCAINHTSIIIGSQRVNLLLERFVAELCGCKPFYYDKDKQTVPFYLLHRNGDHAVESCFGGLKNPPGRRGNKTPGIYYRDEDGKWALCPWKRNEQGAGIVLVRWDPGTSKLEMAVFGYSGRCTAALGRLLTQAEGIPSTLWPPKTAVKGKELGIYLFKFTFENSDATADGEESKAANVELVNLNKDILKKHLR